jgi:tetratricopeptide (TPR) repeat protein
MDGDPTYDLKGSCEAVVSGLKLSNTAARERAYLEAAAKRCPEDRPQPYIEAMRALAARYPDDLDAATLYAESLMIPVRWHWYAADGTPAAGVGDAERTLEEVLRRWPEHAGANHYYIHAVESSPTPERGIPSAQRLMGLVPEAGHIVHMPAHIWLVTGDYEMAATVNERAAAVDQEYFAATNVTAGSYGMYYAHNLHFIAYARWMQGRRADGMRAAEALAVAIAPMAAAMPEMADTFAAIPLFAPVRLGEWDAVMKSPQPGDRMPVSTAIWRYARTLALTARKDGAAAAREKAAFEALRAKIPADAQWGTNNKVADVLALGSEILSARMAGSVAEALPHWERAVTMQDALVYDEPPAWYYPVRESQGAALMRAGKSAEAEKVFRLGLRKSPRNGRLLFGLVESLRVQGKNEDAAWVRKELDAAWAKADIQLKLEEM